MNTITGHITKITADGSLRLVEVQAGDSTFKAIYIENDADHYQEKDEVNLHFKETEVALATQKLPQISLQNQIEGTILEIEKNQILCRVVIETAQGPISSIITAASADRLNFSKGNTAVAMIKTNEIMLSKA